MSASEAGAVEAEPIDRAEHGRGDLFGAEEFLREDLHLLAGDRFNRSKNLVERIIAAEIELLASKVGHAGTGGLKRKQAAVVAVEDAAGGKRLVGWIVC